MTDGTVTREIRQLHVTAGTVSCVKDGTFLCDTAGAVM